MHLENFLLSRPILVMIKREMPRQKPIKSRPVLKALTSTLSTKSYVTSVHRHVITQMRELAKLKEVELSLDLRLSVLNRVLVHVTHTQ